MTTREIYFKVYATNDFLPVGRVYYVHQDIKGVVQLFSCVDVCFRKPHEKNIEIMSKIEKTSGFMFWNNSPEGEAWFKENWEVIGKGLSNMVLSQGAMKMG